VATLGEHQLSIPLMSRPLGHHYRLSSQAAECRRSGQHQHRVRVDGIPREVIDQIRLEHHLLAAHIDRKKPQSLTENLVKLLRVPFGVQDGDSRSLGALVEVIIGQEKGSGNRRTGGQRRTSNK